MVPVPGLYYVSSYTPGQGVVLVRNPNCHGSRPRHSTGRCSTMYAFAKRSTTRSARGRLLGWETSCRRCPSVQPTATCRRECPPSATYTSIRPDLMSSKRERSSGRPTRVAGQLSSTRVTHFHAPAGADHPTTPTPSRCWARCCETAPWSHASPIRSTGVSSPARRGALPQAAPRMNVTRSRY